MSTRIELPDLKRLNDDCAQQVEVLPAAQHADAHVLGAVNIPLRRIDQATTRALDRLRPLVGYCYDHL